MFLWDIGPISNGTAPLGNLQAFIKNKIESFQNVIIIDKIIYISTPVAQSQNGRHWTLINSLMQGIASLIVFIDTKFYDIPSQNLRWSIKHIFDTPSGHACCWSITGSLWYAAWSRFLLDCYIDGSYYRHLGSTIHSSKNVLSLGLGMLDSVPNVLATICT